jgi:hypothetical protein
VATLGVRKGLKMFNWLEKIFGRNPTNDIVRFIRTEFASDTKHLSDADALIYYNSLYRSKK